jgi:hypothetical protein
VMVVGQLVPVQGLLLVLVQVRVQVWMLER